MKDGLPPGTIDPRQPHLSAHHLVQANRPAALAEQGLAGFEGALDARSANRRREPVSIAHEASLAISIAGSACEHVGRQTTTPFNAERLSPPR